MGTRPTRIFSKGIPHLGHLPVPHTRIYVSRLSLPESQTTKIPKADRRLDANSTPGLHTA